MFSFSSRFPIGTMGWHVLRHTHATLSERIGMALSDRQDQMGHADDRMTLHYTHGDMERRRAGLTALTDRLVKRPADTNAIEKGSDLTLLTLTFSRKSL